MEKGISNSTSNKETGRSTNGKGKGKCRILGSACTSRNEKIRNAWSRRRGSKSSIEESRKEEISKNKKSKEMGN